MDIKELDRMAKENRDMPRGLAMHEQCYYISSRGLYQQYAKKMITLDEAKSEKQQVIAVYYQGEEVWQLFMGLFELQEKLRQLKKDGFNTLLEFEILDKIDELL